MKFIILNLHNNTYAIRDANNINEIAEFLDCKVDHSIGRTPAFQVIELNANVVASIDDLC